MSGSSGSRPAGAPVFELGGERAEEAIDLLALAFEQDPAYRYFCSPEGSGYRRRLDIQFRSGLEMHLESRQPVLGSLSGNRLAGVALVNEAGSSFSVWAQLRWSVKVGLLTGPRLPWWNLRHMRVADRSRPPESHVYLPVLAVHADFQGTGHGRALLESVHAPSERHPESTGVCLETENPSNVSFYEHLGYRVIARNRLADIEIVTFFRVDGGGR